MALVRAGILKNLNFNGGQKIIVLNENGSKPLLFLKIGPNTGLNIIYLTPQTNHFF